jgi:hypothetical protein
VSVFIHQIPAPPGDGMLAAVKDNIDGAGMPVTGYNLLRMERQTTIEYRDTDMFWHVGGLYRVEIWEA